MAMVKPDWMSKFADAGHEDIDASLITKGYLKLAQALSGEVNEGEAEAGDFIDTISGHNFGKDVSVTVLKIDHIWKLFDAKNSLVAVSTDGKFWDNGEPLGPDDSWKKRVIEMTVLTAGGDSPLVFAWHGKSFTYGKDLMATIARFIRSGEPIFARNYTLFSEKEKKDKYLYCIAKFKLNSGFNTQEVCAAASELREYLCNYDTQPQAAPALSSVPPLPELSSPINTSVPIGLD